MGKRQKRIFSHQLLSEKEIFLGKTVNVILSDATTLHGRATSISYNQLLVQDMRQRTHTLELSRIAEVVLDFEAAY